jgi:hypothetical protein
MNLILQTPFHSVIIIKLVPQYWGGIIPEPPRGITIAIV